MKNMGSALEKRMKNMGSALDEEYGVGPWKNMGSALEKRILGYRHYIFLFQGLTPLSLPKG
ncbi:hypothetical protein JCM15764A_30900 [Geotalea toluenoxydans]